MGGIDFVLDNGSHVARHQRASFDVLFPLLAEGCLYMIEDMHTAYWPEFQGALRRKGTAVEFLKDKVDEIHRHYIKDGLNNSESMSDIESIQFFDSIAVVKKRKQLPEVSREESIRLHLAKQYCLRKGYFVSSAGSRLPSTISNVLGYAFL